MYRAGFCVNSYTGEKRSIHEEKEVVQNNEQLTTAQLSEKAQQELADIFK